MPEPKTTGRLPIDSPRRRRLPLLLRQAWYSLNQAFRRRLLPLGITPDQFTVLRTMIEAGDAGLTQRELAQAITSDPNTIASLLERMESAGFLERHRDPADGRARRIRLLPSGRQTHQLARNLAVQLQSEILESLPEPEREPFLENLEKVAQASQQAAQQSPKGRPE